MNLFDIVLIALGLSMDAFAVSICKGLSTGKATNKQALTAGLWFGIFQGGMPLLGFFLGYSFKDFITSIDHWIAFGLLAWIGIQMIRESHSDEPASPSFDAKTMLPLAIATSIDALATGIMFSFMEVNILMTVTIIGVITAICSFVGVKAGAFLGNRFRTIAQISGGVVLILMGCKILLEHLGIL